MKVLFITNLPSPYRVDFFNELGKMVDLSVCYERLNSSERNEKWVNKSERTYKEIFASSIKTGVDSSVGLGVIKQINKEYDYVIICGWSSPSIVLAIIYCQLFKIPYILEDDGGLIKPDGERYKLLKKILLKKALAYFTTTDQNIAVISNLGVNINNVYKYPFSSVSKNDIINQSLKNEEIQRIRHSLKIIEKNVILSVGQFIERKGFDILLNSFSSLPDDCGLYIVGGEPTKEYLDIINNKKIKNVHFIDFVEKEKLKRYYMASDIFVLPTREDIWGLVINEAMASGLPVITTNRCGAGLEMITNNINGFIIETNNEEELADKMLTIIYNNDLKKEMKRNTIEIIKKYTIEEMAYWHYNQLKNI